MPELKRQSGNCSTAELVDVEINKRRQVVYTLWFIFMTILAGFSVLSIIDGRVQWGLVLMASTSVCAAYLLHERHCTKEMPGQTIPNLTLLLLAAVLTITGAYDSTGPLFVYPIVVMGVLTNNFRGAAIFGVVTLALLSLLLFVFDDVLLQVEYSTSLKTRLIYSLGVLLAALLVSSYFQDEAQALTQRLHEDVVRLAYFDDLTGLSNRSSFSQWLQRSLERARRDRTRLAMIYIDLDNFKQVNDRFGHSMGDRVLETFGERLGECLRTTDSYLQLVSSEDVARLAGDEFVVVLQQVEGPRAAEIVSQRILAMFEGGFLVDHLNTAVTCSIGIALSEPGKVSAEALINNADAAMYRAKQKGKNRYEFFSSSIATMMQERHRIEAGLQEALDRQGFSLAFMPIYEARSLRIVAFEALLRCDTPKLAGIGPDKFIPVAETTGQIKRIDLWVLENAFAALRRLRADHDFEGTMCVNISALELRNRTFPSQVDYMLRKYGVSPKQVELELTETSEALYDHASLSTLEALKTLGVSLSLDDFGTGYTAFNQLMKFPVDCLKIDQSFVRCLFEQDNAKGEMVEIIKNLASLYSLRVVAEGVETRQQLDYLRKIGCNWLQGYLLSKPVGFEAITQLLEENAQCPLHVQSRTVPSVSISAWR